MKKLNEMKLTIEARSVNEGFSRAAVAAFAALLDPTVEELSDIKTAVSEAVTNTIVHGYREHNGFVFLTATLTDRPSVRIRVRDRASGSPTSDRHGSRCSRRWRANARGWVSP